jgi:hypothetical protein
MKINKIRILYLILINIFKEYKNKAKDFQLKKFIKFNYLEFS